MTKPVFSVLLLLLAAHCSVGRETLPPNAANQPTPIRLGGDRFTLDFDPTHLIFSPDGALLAAIDSVSYAACVWDVVTGKTLWTVPGHSLGSREARYQPRFSADGKALVDSATGRVHNARTGEDVSAQSGFADYQPNLAEVSPDLQSLVERDDEGNLVLRDRAGKRRTPLAFARHFEYSGDGGRLFFTKKDSEDSVDRLVVVDAKSHKTIAEAEIKLPQLRRLQVAWDGSQCWVSDEVTVMHWEVANNKQPVVIVAREVPSEIDLSDSGYLVAPGGGHWLWEDRGVYYQIFDTKSKQARFPARFWLGDTFAFSPDGRTLALGAAGAIRMVDAQTGKHADTRHHPRRVDSLALSRDGATLISAGGGEVRSWSLTDGRLNARLQLPPAYYETDVLVQDGRHVAQLGQNGKLEFWDLTTGRWRGTVGEADFKLSSRSTSFSVSADGNRVIAGSGQRRHARGNDGDNIAILWDLAAGKKTGELPVFGWPQFTRFLNEDRQILVCSNQLAIHDAATGKKTHVLTTGIDSVTIPPMFASDDAGRIVAAMYEQSLGVRISRRSSEPPVVRLEQWALIDDRLETLPTVRVKGGVKHMTSDGERLWTEWPDGTLALWELNTGLLLRELAVPGANVTSILSPADDRRLITGHVGGAIYVWELAPQDGIRAGKEAAWDALASSDGKAIYRAQWQLRALGDDAVPFLLEKLSSLPKKRAVDAATLTKLIADLNDESGEVQAAASTKLRELGQASVAAMRLALEDRATKPAARARMRLLLAAAPREGLAEFLVFSRGCAVLEQLRTPIALTALERLSKESSAPLRHKAISALRRSEAATADFKLAEKIQSPYLGINAKTGETTCVLGAVDSLGPAGMAGLRENDEIVSVDGQALTNFNDLGAEIRRRAVGQKVKIAYRRDGAMQELEVTIGQRPE